MYKHLLVPVDGSPLSDEAIQSSLGLASRLGAAITAFVAEPTLPLPAVGRPASLVHRERDAHDRRIEQHARDVLQRFEAQARAAGVAFSGRHLQTDRVEEAILATAQEAQCDLIVMVTHGRGAFGELLFGSCTKGVMAKTKLPLLVLH